MDEQQETSGEMPLPGGSACCIRKLVFTSGGIVDVPANGLVLLVGPNNVGKTRILADIGKLVSAKGPETSGVVLADIECAASVGVDDFVRFFSGYVAADMKDNVLSAVGLDRSDDEGNYIHFRDLSRALEVGRGYHGVARLVVKHLRTEDRLKIVSPPDNINSYTEPLRHPIQALHGSDEMAHRVGSAFREAFGIGLLVNHTDGKRISLRVADPPADLVGVDRVSSRYREWLARHTHGLHRQGDGMRSFAGTLLHAWATPYYVLAVDEPEAFLHPPQARQMGALLARTPGKFPGRQIFAATHSVDLLKGALDANHSSVLVVRLTRKGDVTTATKLSASQIKDLWQDPLVRHSNALDALFHDRTIICDSDGDCRFYAAMADAVCKRPHDTMFLSAYGKHKAPKVAQALRALGVATSIVSDIDVLNSKDTLQRTVEALGANWATYERDWSTVDDAVRGGKLAPDKGAARTAILETLRDGGDKLLTEEAAAKIREVVKFRSPWDEMKRAGIQRVPQGSAHTAAKRLIEELAKIGLYVIEEGELECFDRTISSKDKVEWLGQVLTKDLATAPELESGRKFVAQLFRLGDSSTVVVIGKEQHTLTGAADRTDPLAPGSSPAIIGSPSSTTLESRATPRDSAGGGATVSTRGVSKVHLRSLVLGFFGGVLAETLLTLAKWLVLGP